MVKSTGDLSSPIFTLRALEWVCVSVAVSTRNGLLSISSFSCKWSAMLFVEAVLYYDYSSLRRGPGRLKLQQHASFDELTNRNYGGMITIDFPRSAVCCLRFIYGQLDHSWTDWLCGFPMLAVSCDHVQNKGLGRKIPYTREDFHRWPVFTQWIRVKLRLMIKDLALLASSSFSSCLSFLLD